MSKPRVVLTDSGHRDVVWPFVTDRLAERLEGECRLDDFNALEALSSLDWDDVSAILDFGLVDESIIEAATSLRVVGAVADACPPPYWDALRARGIPFVDVTRAWAPSVAECGFGLILAGLRRFTYWHSAIASKGLEVWDGRQFIDDPRYFNGDLGTKTVGVLGIGAIGGRIASWCRAFGAEVLATDPFAPTARFAEVGARAVDVDELVSRAEVFVVAAPPTPSARNIISADRVAALPAGGLVVTITRAWAIDGAALRRRVLADELQWAADVYDVEPLPVDDPLIGRPNVIHLPHVAGRTRDTCLRVADLLADDLLRVFDGADPVCVLTPEAVAVRVGAAGEASGR